MDIKTLLMCKESEVFGHIKSVMGEGIEGDDYLWYPSDSPLLFQSHIDTVRKDDNIKLNIGSHVITANGILGADDRAGIHIALKIYEYCIKMKLPMPQFLFTNKEECGGIGMKKFLECDPEFGELNLAIALDRRGASEYVTYNNIPDEVHEYIQNFGFVEEWGTFSDIELFSDHTKIPSVNISVGYYNQHTVHEQLNIDEMTLTLKRCMCIIRDPIEELYPVKERKVKGRYDSYGMYNDYGMYDQYDIRDEKVNDTDWCDWCGMDYAIQKMDYYGTKVYLCGDCADTLEYDMTNGRAYA